MYVCLSLTQRKTKKRNICILWTAESRTGLSPQGASTTSTHRESRITLVGKSKNKTMKASVLKSRPLSFRTERLSVFSLFFFFVFSFFLKSAPWGEGLQGRAACGPIRTVHSRGIPHSGRYKDKMAARRMRAELSRTTEAWHRLTEFTSLRAGSGDSWPTPSGGKEIKVIIRMQSKNIRNEMELLCWNDGGIWHREQDRSRSPAEPLCKRQTDIQTWYTANLESCPQNPEFVGALY